MAKLHVLATIHLIFWHLASAWAWSSAIRCPLRHISRQLRSCASPPAPLVSSEHNKYVRYFDQRLDHFDPRNHGLWKQRWFVNDAFFLHRKSADTDTAPVFLCVGGEGPALTAAVVTQHNVHCSNMVSLAEKHEALVVAVEHRFYGESMPLNNLSNGALAYLSSLQALADLANIHQEVSRLYGLSRKRNPWIAFGGSYPGMLASFFRIKYPHLCWAAVASSAPVHAIANFQGYNDVVAESFANPLVGGSGACRRRIAEAFRQVGVLLGSIAGREKLTREFRVCAAEALEAVENQRVFVQMLSYFFPVQGNDPACSESLCNIEKLCAAMDKGDDAYASLVSLAAEQLSGSCVDVNATKEVEALLNTSSSAGGDRSWLYQTCTEFGFYQTCDPGSQCIFVSSPHLSTLKYNLNLCKTLFDVREATTIQSIEFSNIKYGGRLPLGASRILYPSGQVDPWKASSILEDIDSELEAFVVPGASHHFWTHPAKPSDSKEVALARKRIDDKVKSWLIAFQVRHGVAQERLEEHAYSV